jgi:cardiolipin synthase A/B
VTEGEVTAAVLDLAERLPATDITRLAIAAADGLPALRTLRSTAANPLLRDACDALLTLPIFDPAWLAGALTAAAAAFARANQRQVLDIVWTGPESKIDTARLTAPSVVGLINEAQGELLLVSYATHDEPRITDALHAAARRRVDITLVLERHTDNPSYTATSGAFPGLTARRWVWPRQARPAGAALHAKVIVIDAHTALIGSANLTGRAMAHNLECGVIIRGGFRPKAIRDHLWSLAQQGTLQRV